jgi:hypothetical protein
MEFAGGYQGCCGIVRLREQNDDLTCHKPPLTLLRSRAAGQAQTQLLLCV